VGSPRGAARLVAHTLALIRRSQLTGRGRLVRADSAFYSHALVSAVLKNGADVSITVRMDQVEDGIQHPAAVALVRRAHAPASTARRRQQRLQQLPLGIADR
jgi:hypothetical protein